MQLLGFACVLTLVGIVCAISYAPVAFTLRHYDQKAYIAPLVTLAFFTGEAIRLLFLSLLLLGKESTVGFHYMTGSVGQSLSYTPLVAFAYGGGTLFLSAVFGYIAFTLYSLRKKQLVISFVSLFVLYIGIMCIPTQKIPKLDIAIINTDIDDVQTEVPAIDEYKIHYQQVRALIEAGGSTDLVILPESTYFLQLQSLLRETPPKSTSLIIDSGTIFSSKGSRINSFFYDTTTELTRFSQKNELMAVSEYMPYSLSFLFSLFGQQEKMNEIKEQRNYSQGHARFIHAFEKEGETTRIATLLCSEATSLEALQDIRRLSPDIVVFQSNLSVSRKKVLYDMTLLGYSRVAAATMRTTLIGSTNALSSYVIGPRGEVLLHIPRSSSRTTFSTEML